MAEPKKKRSKSRQRKSRSHKNSIAKMSLTRCLHCKQTKVPHLACSKCGVYDGEKVLKVK